MSILLILFVLLSHVTLKIFIRLIFYCESLFVGLFFMGTSCVLVATSLQSGFVFAHLGAKGLQPAPCLFYVKFSPGVSPPWRTVNSDFSLMYGMVVGFRFLMSGSFCLIHLRGRPTPFDFLTWVALRGSYFGHMCWNQNSVPTCLVLHMELVSGNNLASASTNHSDLEFPAPFLVLSRVIY